MTEANSRGVNKNVEASDVMVGQMGHSQVRQSQIKRTKSVMGQMPEILTSNILTSGR